MGSEMCIRDRVYVLIKKIKIMHLDFKKES